MKQTIESVKESIKLEDLCREYGLDLKQSGGVYKCLCPFHHENNPSFTIYPNDNRYYCFGCDEHGDVIEFVKRKEGIPFNEALAKLCKRGGIKMPAKVNEKTYGSQKIVDEILKTASMYYQLSLSEELNPEAAIPHMYLRQRGVEIHSLGNYRIGFAPNNDHLLSYLKIGFGFKDEDIIESGLAYKNNIGNLCPSFMDRIMFPFVRNDRVVYFTGRSLKDDDEPKYKHLRTGEHINMDIYNQDSLNSRNKEIHVTEGVFDCILAEQEGLPTIATCGPGMRESHIKRLKDKSVFIVFDNDQNDAGKERSIKLARQMFKEGIEAKIVDLPKGNRKLKMDLAEFFGTRRKEDFLDIRDESPGLIDYMLRDMASSPQKEKIKHVKEEIIPLLLSLDEIDAYHWLEKVKDELGFKTEIYKSLQKQFKTARRRYEQDKQKKELEEKTSYVMTPEEEKEALDYLNDPNLIQRIQTDLRTVGIVGEEINALSIYLFSITRKTDMPISAVLFGDSSTGKSYLLNTICSLCPEEERLIITSASSKAFDYGSEDQLKNKFIVIQEIEGMKEVEATIRVMQSEGKLSRYVVQKEFDGGPHKSDAREVECPASIITTTTHDSVHPENSTRIFELYLDQSSEQTKQILQFQKEKAAGWWLEREEEIEKIKKLHQNVQRLIKPLRVRIPYATLIDFPADLSRYRRDNDRFQNLIMAVALVRQHQKVRKQIGDHEVIDADIEDYRIAYKLGSKLLSSTLSPISDRAKEILSVVLSLDSIKAEEFTRADVRNEAKKIGVQVSENNTTIGRQLASLEGIGAIESLQGGPGKTYKYKRIICESGDLEELIKNVIPTPEELEDRIQDDEDKIDEYFSLEHTSTEL